MTQVDTTAIGNTKINCRKRDWFLTWNGNEDDTANRFIDMTEYIKKECKKGVIQVEVGNSGNIHIQGYLEFKNTRTFSSLQKRFNGIHLEIPRNKEACIEYCQKAETSTGVKFLHGFPPKIKDPLDGKELHYWQKDILKYIEDPVKEREILWIVDPKGAKGKTSLAKHICIKNKAALYICGGSKDAKHGVATFMCDKKGNIVNPLEVAIFDFTRSNDGFVSYQAIEEIKNGIFFTTKYESKQMIFNPPHVICFSNFEPDKSKLSEDRWKIIHI